MLTWTGKSFVLIVSDSTALIALAKIGRLSLLGRVYGEVVIGPVVKTEVIDRGKAIRAAEVVEVELALSAAWLRVGRLTARERKAAQALVAASRLDDGEAEAIALAQSRNCPVIVDDKEARAMAASLELEHVGTAGVLLAAFMAGHLRLDNLEKALRDLSNVLWLSPAVVIEILRVARSAKR